MNEENLKEEKNYIRDYFRKGEHNFQSILEVEDIDNNPTILRLKKEINKLLKQAKEKSIEINEKVEKLYSKNYIPINAINCVEYNGDNFNLESGLRVDLNDDDNDEEKYVYYNVDKKRGELEIIIGFDFDKASIITKTYTYTISSNNTKLTKTLYKESVYCFLENKKYYKNMSEKAKKDSYSYDDDIHENVNVNCSYGGLDVFKKYKDRTFINTLFNCNYEGDYDLKDLWEYYQRNKSFEIIMKTSPKEIVDNLLKLENVNNALPINKIIGITQDTYNIALEKGLLKKLVNNRNVITKHNDIFKKTEKEWLDYIELVIGYEQDLDFYDIDYDKDYSWYYRNENNTKDLMVTMCEKYIDYEVLRKNYSLGKLTEYVVNESINQGYERIRDFLEELVDYLKMCEQENIKPTLYSSYLKQTHDIAKRNHNIVVERENEEIFKSKYQDFKTYVGKKYKVFSPKCSDDLKKEGDTLNHCVASYIKRVIDGECLIYFLRKEKDESLITFEVRNNTIMQVKGMHNRKPTNDEVKALQEFANCRNMSCNF